MKHPASSRQIPSALQLAFCKKTITNNSKGATMEHTLPPLPYAMDALQPHISKETLEFHYGKHHQAYDTNLNNLFKGAAYENASLDDFFKNSVGVVVNIA